MPRKFFRRYLPDIHKIKQYRALNIFGQLLHDSNLWHLNRYSVSWAFAIGLFCSFLPIPFQTLLAAGLALLIKANLPLSAVLVWVTNPLTMPAMFYFSYKVGAYILQIPPKALEFQLTLSWISSQLHHIWKPLLLGSVICGLISACIGFITIRIIWRLWTARAWNLRRLRRKLAKKE